MAYYQANEDAHGNPLFKLAAVGAVAFGGYKAARRWAGLPSARGLFKGAAEKVQAGTGAVMDKGRSAVDAATKAEMDSFRAAAREQRIKYGTASEADRAAASATPSKPAPAEPIPSATSESIPDMKPGDSIKNDLGTVSFGNDEWPPKRRTKLL